MASTVGSNGLHHAISLGNIQVSAKGPQFNIESRSYDSEDENMGRRTLCNYQTGMYPRASVYSKGDIREQYCLTDQQLNTIERPRRDKLFGCFSGKATPQSFLGVCVGRRAPSDENLADYAPFYKYPRYQQPPRDLLSYNDDYESSYFRRRPATILNSGSSSGDTKRYTWMTSDDDYYRIERRRPFGNTQYVRPYVVGDYGHERHYLSQSSEQIPGLYQYSTNVAIPPPPPPPFVPIDSVTPRTKHVSFARSHTLTSFDEASLGLRSSLRVKSARSQERLIGGKALIMTAPTAVLQAGNLHPSQRQVHMSIDPHQQLKMQQLIQQQSDVTAYNATSPTYRHQLIVPSHSMPQPNGMGAVHGGYIAHDQQRPPHSPEFLVVEKIKRGAMKTQATQTEIYLAAGKKDVPEHLSLSPRTIHRVKVVSQGAQTNGITNGRKLTKSLSEMVGGRVIVVTDKHKTNDLKTPGEHENLHRTQSEEPPRSPLMIASEMMFGLLSAASSDTNTKTSGPPTQDAQYSRPSSYGSEQVPSFAMDPTRLGCNNVPISNRKQSQDSAMSFKSTDVTYRSLSPSGLCSESDRFSPYDLSLMMSTTTVATTASSTNPSLDNHYSLSNVSQPDSRSALDYQSNSLPRRHCTHHRPEPDVQYSYSLPRRENRYQAELCRHITECTELLKESAEKLSQPKHEPTTAEQRRARRQSMPLYIRNSGLDGQPGSEDFKTLPNNRQKEEQEIFIDFKPHMSDKSSSPSRCRKRLQKTHSDGEILIEKQRQPESSRDSLVIASASEEDLKTPTKDDPKEYLYQNLPIQDEDIFDKQHLSVADLEPNIKQKRDAFRKRSISLENTDDCKDVRLPKSAPLSPCQDYAHMQIQTQQNSAYPSSDSLANDLTRDHSDGIWNESQVTVLIAETSKDAEEQPALLLTPSTRRKHLLLQHQQRSSIDTDGLDFEELQVAAPPSGFQSSPTLKPAATQTCTYPMQQLVATVSPMTSGPPAAMAPTIAVTMMEMAEPSDMVQSCAKYRTISRRASLSPSLQDRRRIEPLIHSAYSPNRPTDSSDFGTTPGTISRGDSGQKNTDISECSTNTEEYVTCTDTSKRTPGMRTPSTTASSSSTQVPVSAQSSHGEKTQNGSSFESASSLYSTRGDGLSEDLPANIESETLTFPSISSAKKISPSHSVSSTSSGSYNVGKDAKQLQQQTPTAPDILPSAMIPKMKCESVSDDERSEKRYSSSGYYESPQDQTPCANQRRMRVEEERRKRKNNMKLDIERENLRALTSPIKKPTPLVPFKQISPDDRSALNTLDGASPSKIKRFRPKIRRQLKKTSREDLFQRKSISKPTDPTATVTSPCRNDAAPEIGSEKRLKAKSIESLRSVSPGSDSVFYSEADASADKQVHCHHCGKEVEIVTAVSGSHESIPPIADDHELDIVKPPADFADSPVTTKTSQRLYKKMDKRFRSEERHGDRGRHYRSRQETVRAKSEERGKDSSSRCSPKLRPADSSPCVLPPDDMSRSDLEKEPIIYKGLYSEDLYARLTDADVWIQLDHKSFDRHRDRRGSTDSEKSFHSKFQVILHRLVQRRCTLEMYHRQKSNTFKVDKTVIVQSDSGEFGFRIHGSKPVVVAAIEPDTPAESSGLEVGDIIIAVNGVPVLDKHHTEVVKIAHAGCETLQLEVARTIGVLMNEQQEAATPALYTGYLWRQSGQAKGSPNAKKWVRRWFCLRPDHCLYYYKTDTETQPVGATILTNHTVSQCSTDVGKPHAFKIDSGEGIPMYLAADSEDAANRWIAIISRASKESDSWLEISSRNLSLPPNGIQRPDCFGYLMKLGSRWRGWSKRYCVLKNACLYFYQDANSKSAFGMACLQGYKVLAISSNAAGRKNSFEIVPPGPKHRHYYFSGESDMDKKRWISALEYSIDRWIKAG